MGFDKNVVAVQEYVAPEILVTEISDGVAPLHVSDHNLKKLRDWD